MSFFVIMASYTFALGCFLNFLLLKVRGTASAVYLERSKRFRTIIEGGGQLKDEHAAAAEPKPPVKVVMLHPDLGIGGAERVILDMAITLQSRQIDGRPIEVTIVTNHHDEARCFKETNDGSVRVVVRAGWLPASILRRFKVLCATVRMSLAAFLACRAQPDTDIFIVDQVAAVMPWLRWFAPSTPILFYCHFPDQKCDPNRNLDGTYRTRNGAPPPFHTPYRKLFDGIEARGMKAATRIICNSRFSLGVTVATFPELADRLSDARDVLYPPVAPVVVAAPSGGPPSEELIAVREALAGHVAFVSINRFERGKNILLAVEGFVRLLADSSDPASLRLILVGGYDARQRENVEYFAEVEAAALEQYKIPRGQLLMLRNVSDEAKQALLAGMRALVYTPSSEHFGIVPVEAMMHGRPVIAVNNGGPCESVGDLATEPESAGGILCEPSPATFGEAMTRLASDAAFAAKLGEQGKARATAQFSTAIFGDKLTECVEGMCDMARERMWNEFRDVAGWKAPSAAEDRQAPAQPSSEANDSGASKKDQ